MNTKRTTKMRGSSTSRAGEFVEIIGAREHNLDVEHLVLPKNALVVLTGPSGSGKSSLAFDTLYAEGQRRYVESLSAYARQFLGRLERPQVEKLRGLSPTIAIEQKSASGNPRSTVATITEISDYLRVLYARIGVQHCYECGKVVAGRSVDEIVRELCASLDGTQGLLVSPICRNRKGEFKTEFDTFREKGLIRIRLDGAIHRLDALPAIDKKKKHNLDVVIDRVKIASSERARLAESVELALREGKGEMIFVAEGKDALERGFSEARTCCGISYPVLSPQSFSFNSPVGMCMHCNGLGTRMEIDPELLINPEVSIREGAIAPWAKSAERGEGWTFRIIEAMSEATGVDLDKPWKKLSKAQQHQVLYGLEGKKIRVTWGKEGTENHGSWGIRFQGVIPTLMRRYQETNSEAMREHYRQYFRNFTCELCEGTRLRRETLSVKIGGLGIAGVLSKSVRDADKHVTELKLSKSEATIAESVVREIRSRLSFLTNVGLQYLTLDRSGPTLSGGEAQRIRLASQLGSELSGVMYVLDEPSIGLHARDNEKLLKTLCGLRDLGNSVLVVEHDEETMLAADYIVDFGPGAGRLGGKVIFAGTPKELLRDKKSVTGAFLTGKRSIAVPKTRRTARGTLTVTGAAENNLQNVDVKFPLGVLTAVTGPSGAGKSSLVNGILLPALSRHLHNSTDSVGKHRGIEGLEHIDKVIAIDQQPIGRTPRSNPGTYTKAFDEIRAIFAQVPDARARGYAAARFSFNVKGGRCEACQGDGVVKVEMHFLSDVYVTCEICNAKRYNESTLEIRYRNKNIHEILESSIDECREVFAAHPTLCRILQTLVDVGLGYMKIGQPATTLSGGEAQRIKLAKELARVQTGRTLYVLDEPTTGLHFTDVERLLGVLDKLVVAGNSVVVIEHNMDVIKCADWVIDLGPEGGDAGGLVMAEGTPEQVAKSKKTATAPYLAKVLAPR